MQSIATHFHFERLAIYKAMKVLIVDMGFFIYAGWSVRIGRYNSN